MPRARPSRGVPSLSGASPPSPLKKQIIINASKDRSRIAIVEDGELVELYVENPDNVRTLGNIYLGKVQKVMPALRAAFVDVGLKQDAFLHFSDLTDNAPQTFAMAGEEVPGLDAPVLSLAPQKRVADDDSEPDVEDKLEVEVEEPKSRTASRSRRRSRGRGRGRGRTTDRPEEEEEEETPKKKRSRHVIDLTTKPSRPAPRRAQAPEPARDTEAAVEDAPEPTRSRRRSRSSDAPAADAAPVETPAATEEASDEPQARAPRRSRSRAAESDTSAPDADATQEAPSNRSDEASEDGQADAPKKRRRGGRRRRGKGGSDAPEAQDDASTETTTAGETITPDAEAAPEPTRSRRRSRSSDAEAPADATSEDTPTDGPRRNRRGQFAAKATPEPEAQDTSDTDAQSAEAPDADAESGRSRRGRRSRSSDTAADRTASGDTAEATSDDEAPSGRSRRGGRSRGESSSRDTSGRDKESSRDKEPGRDKDGGRGRSQDGAREAKTDTDTSGSGRRGSDRNGSDRGRGSDKGRRDSSRSRTSGSGQVPPAEDLLRRDGRVLVKVTKEPISTKGSRVSTDLSIAGRFLVLVPAADYIAVSKKIESAKERRRLRTLAQSLKPDGFGVIVRTVAEGRDAKSLDTDLRLLVDKWREIDKKLAGRPQPPVLLYEDVNMVSSIIRDLFSDDYDRILVDDPKVFKNVQAYVKAVAPSMADKVELHKGSTPVFRSFGIEKQVEEAFSKRVNMRGGGYLYIETTEAMHVVDVNSGRAGRGKSQKENLIAVNVEAAREVAKQLRLRDLGGIIVVDFIDLKYDRDRKKVTDALKEAFAKDRAVTKLLPMSDFGLVQITRQRLRPSITTQATDDNGEPLDAADAARMAGAGEIAQPGRPDRHDDDADTDGDRAPRRSDRRDDRRESRRDDRPAVEPEDATPEALTSAVRAWLDQYRKTVDDQYKARPILVRVHPLLGAYLRRGFPSPLTRWRLSLRGIAFQLHEDATVDPLTFDVRDEKSGRSLLKKYQA